MSGKMAVNRATTTTVVAVAMLGLVVAQGWAGTVTYTETCKDQLYCSGNSADGYSCDEVYGGTFKVKGTLFTDGSLSNLTFDTGASYMISIYNPDGSVAWRTSDTFADADPPLQPNAKKVGFTLATEYTDDNGNDHLIKYGTISLVLGKKGLTVVVSTKTGTDKNGDSYGYSYQDSPVAVNYDDEGTGTISGDVCAMAVELDASDGTQYIDAYTLPIVGGESTKTVNAKDGDSYDLSSITLKATGVPYHQ